MFGTDKYYTVGRRAEDPGPPEYGAAVLPVVSC